MTDNLQALREALQRAADMETALAAAMAKWTQAIASHAGAELVGAAPREAGSD